VAADPKNLDLTVYQGRTFRHIVRWETSPTVYKPITSVTRTAPAVVTAVGHGVQTGWYVVVTDVGGMTEINASANAPRSSDYGQATKIDVDTLSLDGVDAARFSAYTSGGYLRYNTPKSLSGAVARMDLRDRVGGTLLLALSSTTGEITLDDTNHQIIIEMTPAITELMAYTKAVYDLEIEESDGAVSVLLLGGVTVIPEVTTSL
jgi:hypothetical protein